MQPPLPATPADSPIRVGLFIADLTGIVALQKLDLHRRFHLASVVATPGLELPRLPSHTTAASSSQVAPLAENSSLQIVWLSGESASLLCDHAATLLESRKHVVLARPIDFSPAQWSHLESLAEKFKRHLIVYYPGDELSEFIQIRDVVASGKLGLLQRILFVDFSISTPPQIPSDQPLKPIADPQMTLGLWESSGLEAVHQILSLVPHPVARVYAAAPTPSELSLQLEFHNGLTAHWEIGRRHPAPLTSGWYLHGASGGYADRTTYRLDTDGELVKTPLAPPAISPTPFLDDLANILVSAPFPSSAYLTHQRILSGLSLAIHRSLASHTWEPVS